MAVVCLSLGIVFASHTSRGGPFVVGSHHLVGALGRRGHRVLHIGRPFTPPELLDARRPDVRCRARAMGRERMVDGVPELTPIAAAPMQWACRRYLRTGHNAYVRTLPRLGRAARRSVGDVDALIVDEPRMAGVEGQIEAKVLVYRATDLIPDISPYPFAAKMEERLADAADGLIGTSRPVLDHLERLAPGKPSLLLENGVDAGHFSRPAPLPREYATGGARLVYVGALDERFDAQAVAGMAAARPDAVVYIIGPQHQLQPSARASLQAGNIHLLGVRRYDELPGYLQHAHAGLLPLGRHPANRGRSPMKIHEYLAAGLPVVARSTQELQRRATPHVHLYDDDPEPALLQALGDDGRGAQKAAQAQDWQAKAVEVEQFLGKLGC